jgi:DNA polymerase-3 subunit epsilon
MALADLPVMLLDIQASAAASAGGALLEVGWQRHPVSGPNADTQTHLVEMPTTEIHPRLARLTGLSTEQMQAARPLDEIWNHLQVAAGEIAAANDLPGACGNTLSICPVVVHYARFEAPFLAQLRPRNQAAPAVCFDLICTHEIARRLLPGLPRKGLRAVAGYFGHDTHPLRRCCHHLTATGVIWTALAKKLSSHHGIDSFAELKAWIDNTPVPRPGARQFQVPMQSVRELPDNPGIYRFLSRTGKPLYVGKAKALNQRVRTYFQPRRHHPEHILEMLSRAAAVKTTPTPTALEAALLEQDVIKRLAPPYNIALAPHTTELQFWSRDLTSQAPQVDARHPWGPIPNGVPFTLMAALVKALAAGDDDSRQTRLRITLDHTREKSLDRTCLAAGLGLFHHTHQGLLQHMSPGRAIMTLGRQLWAKEGIDAKKNTDAAADEETPESPFLWTPERVCRTLEHAARHAGALLRRSRWLVLLGNATLVWRLSDTNSEAYRGLVFHAGRVIARENLSQMAAATQVKAPPQHRNWRPQNKTTYDRLRVATTELRRLIREERPVSMVLSGTGRPTLKRECLARLLSWI